MRTVKDLRNYLDEHCLSPEGFGELTGVSNMTWRRFLMRPDSSVLADKYRKVVEVSLTSEESISLDPLKVVLEGFGKNEKSLRAKIESFAKGATANAVFWKKNERHLTTVRAGAEFQSGIRVLLKYLKANGPCSKYSLAAMGALAYFINPADLIADTLIGVGLIDDMGVVYFVRGLISKDPKELKT